MKYVREISPICFEMKFILEIRYLVLLDIIFVNLPATTLLKIDTAWTFITINNIPDEEYFKTAVRCTTSYF